MNGLGKLLVGSEDSIPMGAFAVYREGAPKKSVEGEVIYQMETIFECNGSEAEVLVGIGMIMSELNAGHTVLFAVNPADDLEEWGLDKVNWYHPTD